MDNIKMDSLYDRSFQLSLAISRMRAVAQSFADEYIDSGDEPGMSVLYRSEHFTNLFNAMFFMMADIDDDAKSLYKTLEAEKVKAGA